MMEITAAFDVSEQLEEEGERPLDATEPRRAARRYVEERIDEVRRELAVFEACGLEGIGDSRNLDTEEELLEELAYASATGDLEPWDRKD